MVDQDHYSGEDGEIIGQTTLEISETDDLLHQNSAADPDGDQLFLIGGGPYTSDYQVDYQDFSVVDGDPPEFELFAFQIQIDGVARYFVFAKDPGFDPEVGDDLTVSDYNTFSNTEYVDIGSAVCFAKDTLIRTPGAKHASKHSSRVTRSRLWIRGHNMCFGPGHAR